MNAKRLTLNLDYLMEEQPSQRFPRARTDLTSISAPVISSSNVYPMFSPTNGDENPGYNFETSPNKKDVDFFGRDSSGTVSAFLTESTDTSVRSLSRSSFQPQPSYAQQRMQYQQASAVAAAPQQGNRFAMYSEADEFGGAGKITLNPVTVSLVDFQKSANQMNCIASNRTSTAMDVLATEDETMMMVTDQYGRPKVRTSGGMNAWTHTTGTTAIQSPFALNHISIPSTPSAVTNEIGTPVVVDFTIAGTPRTAESFDCDYMYLRERSSPF